MPYFLYPNSAYFMQTHEVNSVAVFRAIRALTEKGKERGSIRLSDKINILYAREIDARDKEQIVVQVEGVD